MLNQVTLVGNLGQNPELKTFPNGTQVCKFGLGVSRGVKVDGAYQYVTDWFNVTCFNKTAEKVATQGYKGLRVCVSGSLRTNQYEKKDGTQVKDVQIIAYKVIFIVPKQDQAYQPPVDAQAWDRDTTQEPIFSDDDLPF